MSVEVSSIILTSFSEGEREEGGRGSFTIIQPNKKNQPLKKLMSTIINYFILSLLNLVHLSLPIYADRLEKNCNSVDKFSEKRVPDTLTTYTTSDFLNHTLKYTCYHQVL